MSNSQENSAFKETSSNDPQISQDQPPQYQYPPQQIPMPQQPVMYTAPYPGSQAAYYAPPNAPGNVQGYVYTQAPPKQPDYTGMPQQQQPQIVYIQAAQPQVTQIQSNEGSETGTGCCLFIGGFFFPIVWALALCWQPTTEGGRSWKNINTFMAALTLILVIVLIGMRGVY